MTRAFRRLPALILAAVLALGGLGHFAHDLEHAAHDPIGAHDEHPCTACSVLHVGAPVSVTVAVAAPVHRQVIHAAARVAAAPVATLRVASIPRAPPIA